MRFLRYAVAGLFTASFAAAYAVANPVNFSETTGFGLDALRVQIKKIRVDTEIVNPFDPSRPQIYSVYYDIPFRFDIATLHLIPDLSGAQATNDPSRMCANLSVLVNNAFDGTVLKGAMVTVNGANVATNDQGIAAFSNVSSGETTVAVAVSGFVADSSVKNLACGANNVTLALNPTSGTGAVAANQVRVVLTWGETPEDLDSHLTGPQPGLSASSLNEANRFHVYFWNETSDVANLDVDDTTSFGPETITISPPTDASALRPGVYRYSVHHYEGTSTMKDAVVKLYVGNNAPRTFTPDAAMVTGTSDLWTVFELSVDAAGRVSILPVNAYKAGIYEDNVRSGERHYGAAESPDLLDLRK
jgi:hypothetical protein